MIDFINVSISYLIELIVAWQYFHSFYYSKKIKRTEIILMTSGYILLFCLFWLRVLWLNAVDFIIINAFLCFCLYSSNIVTSFFHGIILTGAMTVTELGIELISMRFLGGFLTFTHNAITYVIVNTISRLFYYLVIQIIIRIFAPKRKETEVKSGFTILLSMIPATTVWLSVAAIICCADMQMSDMMEIVLLISVFLLFIINFIVFWAYDSNQKFMRDYLSARENLKEQQAETVYYRKLAKQTENQKILIHDIKNHLQTIAGLSDNGGKSEIGDYIQQLLEMPAMKPSVTYCSHPVLNVILGQYRETCEQRGIKFGVDVRKNSIDYMTVDDLTALFGNLLKNAVEATVGAPEAYIDVTVNYNYEVRRTFISVENSVLHPPVYDGDGKLVSQKEDGKLHGVGIKSIQRVADHYRGSVSYYYDEAAKSFHAMVLLSNDGKLH